MLSPVRSRILTGATLLAALLSLANPTNQQQSAFSKPTPARNDATEAENVFPPTETLLPDCSSGHDVASRNFFLVSTIDGQMSALDAVEGKILWQTKIADKLLSSTIGEFLDMNNKGEIVKVMPSLDGTIHVRRGLGEYTRVPAENLLKSSVKISEKLVVVGGHESQVIGIDLSSGKIIYECGAKGCSQNDTSNFENVVVIKRKFHAVRAVHAVNGREEWHYEVNDPEVVSVSRSNCHNHDHSKFRVDFKVQISCGVIDFEVFQTNDSNSEKFVRFWSHKFNVPIVKIWHHSDGQTLPVDLFGHAVGMNDLIQSRPDQQLQYYIGTFNNQMYIQNPPDVSSTLPKEDNPQKTRDELEIVEVRFKPSLPAIAGPKESVEETESNHTETKYELAVRNDFPFVSFNREQKTGYYVLKKIKNKDEQCQRLPHEKDYDDQRNDSEVIEDSPYQEQIQQIINIVNNRTLSSYWKQITAICILFYSVVSFISKNLPKLIKRLRKNPAIEELDALKKHLEETVRLKEKAEQEISVQTEAVSNLTEEVSISQKSEVSVETPKQEYVSRFYTDFEPKSQLGKGGFGVVFEAKNKFDQQIYAVKRIAMPSKREKREKFMQEVRILSVLEHRGIVRYYNAWIEEPPVGWQDEKDKEWDFEFSKMDTMDGEEEEEDKSEDSESHEEEDESQSQSFPVQATQSNSFSISFRDSSASKRFAVEETSSELKEQDSLVSFRDSERKGDEEESENEESDENHSEWTNDKSQNESKSEQLVGRRSRTTSQSSRNGLPKPKVYVYIQMQLCQKITLKHWLMDHERRSQESWLPIYIQILSAVDYVHQMKLIHRDLKPSNIFFAQDNTVKIGDFGLVTNILDEGELTIVNAGKVRQNVAYTNEVGTHTYMSPEQIKKLPYNHKVDIYSIGLILYELLERFNTETERLIKLQAARQKQFDSDFVSKNTRECDILKKLLSVDPNERPEARDLLKEDIFCNEHV